MSSPTAWPLLATMLLALGMTACPEEQSPPPPPLGGTDTADTGNTSAADDTTAATATSESGPNPPGMIPTCATSELRMVGTVDDQPLNVAPPVTGEDYDGVGAKRVLLDFEGGQLRLEWEETMAGPVDVTGYLDTPELDGRLCVGEGSTLDLDPMQSLPFELRGLSVAAGGDCADAVPVAGQILGCWGAGW